MCALGQRAGEHQRGGGRSVCVRVRGGASIREEIGACVWVTDCVSRLQAMARDEARRRLRNLTDQLQIPGNS